MDHNDRHGRTTRADHDPRRRPADGFRTRDDRRFHVLATRALAHLPEDLRRHVVHARVHVATVPSLQGLTRAELGEALPLAAVVLHPDDPADITVYRRPLEMRAASREDLHELLVQALDRAVRRELGRPPDPDV